MSEGDSDDFDPRMRELGELIETIERTCTSETLEPARALMSAVLAVHASGLRTLIAELQAAGAAESLRAACRHPNVASLLLLHELHPEPLADRVRRALEHANDHARPGARAELLMVDGDHVQIAIRVEAGSAAAGVHLRHILEQQLCERAPDAQLTIAGGTGAEHEVLVPASRLIARIGAVRE